VGAEPRIGSDGIAAASLLPGVVTPIGPICLGYGLAQAGHQGIFFYLERPLFH